MDDQLHNQFKSVKFTPEITEMYSSIIQSDLITKKVLLLIARNLHEQENTKKLMGVTINDITEKLQIQRKQKVAKGRTFTFELTHNNIDRKAAERIVDKLLSMSLLYYKPVKPYKYLFMTQRGIQVTQELIKKSEGAKKDA
ncbi:hypothetical protein [Cytobacillus gottheilii]|uniref:hypothetical protein n=1 Tax=Cytobacillus gottheilii TaxID=859144 RepID=UPI002495483C|nr:hypothetical protein [Cytobacillus gottheilii]